MAFLELKALIAATTARLPGVRPADINQAVMDGSGTKLMLFVQDVKRRCRAQYASVGFRKPRPRSVRFEGCVSWGMSSKALRFKNKF